MNEKPIRVGVVPIGNLDGIFAKTVAAHLLGYFHLQVDILSPLGHPDYAFDPGRRQFDAGLILKALGKRPFRNSQKVIGIVDVDLFVPILTHVFGEAEQGGRHALVSLHRLRKREDGAPTPLSQLLERTAKVALHETGHLFDLLHCREKRCVMHFSGSLRDLDQTPLFLCKYCSLYLRDAFKRASRP
ncbi:MAG: archaemetzincin family Zn-dependent metalloprotease [Deltaproteobacteria bacterium]|nr:archaemetzincin family Zn-dependent metalloprotease [Deltaproteobacteria bacterium]